MGVRRMDLEQFLAELEEIPPRPKRAGSSSQHQDALLGATLTAAAAADTAAADSLLMRRTGRLLAKDDLQAWDSAEAQKKKLLSLLVTPEKASAHGDLLDAQARRRDDASDDVPSVSGSSTINREERLALAKSLRLASDDELLREAMEVSSALTAFSPTPVTAPTSMRRSAELAAKDTPGRQRKASSSRPLSRRYLSDTPHTSQIMRTSSPLRVRGEALAWAAEYGDAEDEDGLLRIPAV